MLLAAGIATAIVTPQTVLAHPHVFAEARLDVVIEGGQSVTALRHLWRFDDLFSSTVLVEFDKNGDLELDQDELAAVADTVHQSLADFDYFQLVTANGKTVAMAPPEKLIAQFTDNQLIILFESQPAQPIQLAGKLDFGVYDPTFYTAIDFTEDDMLVALQLPARCSRAVVRPDPDEAIALNQERLTEEFFNDPSGNDLGSIFATRLELTCTAEG